MCCWSCLEITDKISDELEILCAILNHLHLVIWSITNLCNSLLFTEINVSGGYSFRQWGWGSGSIKITQNDTYVPMAATLTRELSAFTTRVRRSIRYTIVGRRRRGFMCATFVYCSFWRCIDPVGARLNHIHVVGHGGDNDFPQTAAVNAIKTSVSCNQNRCGNDYEFWFTKVPLGQFIIAQKWP